MGSEGGVLWRLPDDWRAEEGPPTPSLLVVCLPSSPGARPPPSPP